MDKINTEKIHLTLRSLFRLSELQRLKAPKLILNLENENLKEKLSSLNAEEIKYISNYYDLYIKKTCVEEILAELNFSQKIKKDILEYN